MYEAIGLLLPFLLLPSRLTHRRIHLLVDNISLVWAWKKRHMKNDVLTSIVLRTLHILEAALPCKIYISHLPRVSTRAAVLADNLSRKSTTSLADKQVLTHPNPALPKLFLDWLSNPRCDWSIPLKIVQSLKSK